ncbi:hypothetical protein CU097_006984 [Rhizopus azygosporus]|uniref:Uncharacterized protein n=1 Tax=Rhizopus azygosporus TaxID=86630 RepID=A0A367J6C2_RHIAZ|nr:hypothetical protein CU097_006984 [Rhizopus azygosporus]
MLHVFYNKINIKHTFEIFPFFSHENVPICFGLDILSRLDIGITGLASFHFDHTGPKKPEINMKNTSCNLPGSIIHLKTRPGTVVYRCRYPLPEAYREVVQQ